MAEYKSSKQLLAKSQENLKKVEKLNKDVSETSASLSQEEEKLNSVDSSRNKMIKHSDNLNSSLQQMSSLVDNVNSSLIGLTSAFSNLDSNSNAINSLLATNLISLTQINSVISAFRSDYLMAKNGKKLDGNGYYNPNLIINSLGGIKTGNKQIDGILKDLRKAANYANKSSNLVRSKLGNTRMAKDSNESGGLIDKILGGIQQAQSFAGLGTLLPNEKIAGFAEKLGGLDTSSVGGLLGSMMSDKNKKAILNPLMELGMDFNNSNNPFKRFLGGAMSKVGLSKSKKEREKDPNLVMSSLAPFADDIKDMVELKVKSIHSRPKSIPDYTTPVWIVNSEDQIDYVKNKSETKDFELKEKRLREILEGAANNTKDKYGRELLTRDSSGYHGIATKGFGQERIKKMQKDSKQRIYNINHESVNSNSEIAKQMRELGSESLGILDNIDPSMGTGGLVNGLVNSLSNGDTSLGGVKKIGSTLFKSAREIGRDFVGSHKGGKKGKSKSGNNKKSYNVMVHHDERILDPEALQQQQALDNTSLAMGQTIGFLNSAINLQKMKIQLFVKYANNEKVSPEQLKTDKNIIGEDTIKQLGDSANINEYANLVNDNKLKISNKKNNSQTTSEYFGLNNKKEDSNHTNINENSLINSNMLENIIKDTSNAEPSENQSEIDDNRKKEIDEKSEANISEYKELVEEREENEKREIDEETDTKKKIKEDFEKKSSIIEKANKTKAWAIEKAGNAASRAKKLANSIKTFAIEKAGQAKLIANNLKDTMSRIAKKKLKSAFLLGEKLKAKLGNIISKLSKSTLLEKAKAIKIAAIEKIKSLIHTTKESLEGAATVAEAPIEASKAIPVVGPGIAIAAGAAATAAITGIAIAAMAKAKKGKKTEINTDKIGKDVEKLTEKAKNKSEKEEEKKNKKEEKENKEEKKINNNMPESIKEKEEKENDKIEEDLNKVSEATANSNPSNINNSKAYVSENNINQSNQIATNEQTNLLSYLNKKQISALKKGSNSSLAKLMLSSPEKAANIIFMLNNGPGLIGLKNTKGNDLNNIENATVETVTSSNTSIDSSDNKNNSVWGKLLNKLKNKNDFLSDDISSKGYSEDLSLTSLLLGQTKNSAGLFNAFARKMGFATIEDDNGNALFSSTIRKNAQDEALRKNANAFANQNSSSITASSSSISNNENSSYDGSSYMEYDQDGTWSNGTTKQDIDTSKYFTTNNGSANLVTNILNNNWKKYKSDNNIDDEATTQPNSSKTYVGDFLNKEYDKMNKAFISNVVFTNNDTMLYMHEKMAKSIKDSNPWYMPKPMKEGDSEKKLFKNYIKRISKLDYSKYGLGKSFRRFGSGEKDYDFLNASEYALSHGYKEKDGGTYPQFFTNYLKKDGINVQNAGSIAEIKRELASGKPFILMGKDVSENGNTPYGSSPHYVVANGYDGKNIRIIDSESKNDYDIYNADNVLKHSSIKLGTKRQIKNSSSSSSKPIKNKNNIVSKSNRISKVSNKVNSSQRITSNSNAPIYNKNNYLKSSKSRYGRGFSNEENVKKFWAYALGSGMSDSYIAGIAGNIDAESGFDPFIMEGGKHNTSVPYHSGGYGLIQWTGSSFQKVSDEYIKKYSNYGGLNSLEGQIFWIIECATMSERAASYGDGALSYAVQCLKGYGSLDQLNNKTPEEAAKIWHNGVERSKNGVSDRGERARKYYNAFAGKITPSLDMASSGTVYNKTCWSGDSRTEQMHNYFPDLEAYATKGGQTIDYFLSHYSEISNKEGYNIFCWYGVNGATTAGAKKTAEAYNKLASDLKGKSQVYAGTIGHCPNGTGSNKVEGGAGQSVDKQNASVEEFNEELKKNLSSDVKIIDTYSFIKELESSMGANNMTKDNLHYTKECSQKIREYVDEQIRLSGGVSGNSVTGNSVTGVAIGDLYVTLQGYVDAYDELSKYKKGSDIWDGVSSNPNIETSQATPISQSNYTPSNNSNNQTNSVSNPSNNKPSGNTPELTPEQNKEINDNTPNNSVVNPSNNSEVYVKNGTLYVVNNIEYGVKTNITSIIDEFNELNKVQDDSLDVLNIIYEKLLKRKGKNPINNRIQGYDYLLKKRRFV